MFLFLFLPVSLLIQNVWRSCIAGGSNVSEQGEEGHVCERRRVMRWDSGLAKEPISLLAALVDLGSKVRENSLWQAASTLVNELHETLV